MKVVFMGTPDFAVKALEELVREKYEIACVVTQPDKPKGRGNILCLNFSCLATKYEFYFILLYHMHVLFQETF